MSVFGRNAHSKSINQLRYAHRHAEHPLHRAGEPLLPSRKSQNVLQNTTGAVEMGAPADTQINGLTFVFASTPREVENLVTREFHADPNLHKNANVALVGSYSTEGSPSVTFDWTWRWKPPKITEDRGGGWRTSCSVRGPWVNSFEMVADAGSSLSSTTSGPTG